MTPETIKAFERLAEILEAHSCTLCGAHDDHDQCEQPDVAGAIRQVLAEESK